MFVIAQPQSPDAAGSPPVSNPLLVGGQDGTNVRVLLVDSAGRPLVVGPGTPGSAPVGGPVYVAGQDGTNLRALLTTAEGVPWMRHYTYQTYHVGVLAQAPGNGKSMLALANTSASAVVRVWQARLMNAATSAVTGVAAAFQLRRFTTKTGGTAATPQALDASDSLPAGITAATGATLTSEGGTPLLQRLWSTDEWGPGTLDVEAHEHGLQNTIPFYEWKPPMRPITLRQNQGLTLRCNTNTTAGLWDVEFYFTVET